MIEITQEEVKHFLVKATLQFKPGQGKVSFPLIKRIHRRLQNGHTFDPIKVVDGVVVDGHHRYICLSLLQYEIETIPGGKNLIRKAFEWVEMNVELQDYDTLPQVKSFEMRYDH